jgi:hypothetical protein
MVVDPSANEPNEALGLGQDDAIDGGLLRSSAISLV